MNGRAATWQGVEKRLTAAEDSQVDPNALLKAGFVLSVLPAARLQRGCRL